MIFKVEMARETLLTLARGKTQVKYGQSLPLWGHGRLQTFAILSHWLFARQNMGWITHIPACTGHVNFCWIAVHGPCSITRLRLLIGLAASNNGMINS
jgi:hypothetical protein